jgi:UDP-glucuronate decarboxylase
MEKSAISIPLNELQELYLRMPGYEIQDGEIRYDPLIKRYPTVKKLKFGEQKRILVTGGAGFVGSHLVDRLMKMGHLVTVLDNFFTGKQRNIDHWMGHPHFELIRHDIVDPFLIEVDEIYHLACPASPIHYQTNPVKTVKTNVLGTLNMLGLAKRTKATFLLASTSGTIDLIRNLRRPTSSSPNRRILGTCESNWSKSLL